MLRVLKIVLAILLASIFLAAWVIQDKLFLNWDVSALLDTTRKMLAGGTYSNDFFTPNPPMILYLYSLPIILSKLTHITIILTFRIYIFLLAALSISMCYSLVQVIIPRKNPLTLLIFLCTLLLVFTILPFYEFGQRDHLVIIFAMPYFLLAAYRLQGHSINAYYAVAIGIFAGLGFAIKPHFLLPLILIELYYIYHKKTWTAWLRPEALAILSLLIAYLATTILLYPDYLFIVVPFMMKLYYKNLSMPWYILMLHPVVLIGLLSIGFFIVQYKESTYKILGSILCLTVVGFLLSYLTQHIYFYYHLIPLYSCAMILLVFTTCDFAEKNGYVFTGALAGVIFALPVHIAYNQYRWGIKFKQITLAPLVSFIKTLPPKRSVYFFSEMNYGSSLIDYADATIPQRFDCLWMIGNLIDMHKANGDNALRQYFKTNHDKYFFLTIIAEDLHKHHPDLVFVDVRKINVGLLNLHFNHFDYLDYFSENQEFRSEWKYYSYLTTIGEPGLSYKLQVYQRNDNAKGL